MPSLTPLQVSLDCGPSWSWKGNSSLRLESGGVSRPFWLGPSMLPTFNNYGDLVGAFLRTSTSTRPRLNLLLLRRACVYAFTPKLCHAVYRFDCLFSMTLQGGADDARVRGVRHCGHGRSLRPRQNMLFLLPKFPMPNFPNSAYYARRIMPNHAQLCRPLPQRRTGEMPKNAKNVPHVPKNGQHFQKALRIPRKCLKLPASCQNYRFPYYPESNAGMFRLTLQSLLHFLRPSASPL